MTLERGVGCAEDEDVMGLRGTGRRRESGFFRRAALKSATFLHKFSRMDGVDATTRRLSTAAATMGAGMAVLKICPRARDENRRISRDRDETPSRRRLCSASDAMSTSAHAP